MVLVLLAFFGVDCVFGGGCVSSIAFTWRAFVPKFLFLTSRFGRLLVLVASVFFGAGMGTAT